MLVMAHGGPTGAATRGLQLRVQFWTSRGFAVLDVDYRGSVGYGRAHREALQGAWGEKDADDVIAAAEAAVKRGLAAPERLIATGRSAGGFTALCALIRSNLFRAASIHFGVADLATLLATTHKYEAGYIYGLTGTEAGETDQVFEARSPLAQAGRISAPVLLLQGLDDPAVPAQQARDIADSLKRRGVPVAHVEFAGEGHGFRRAETIRTAFLAELAFFSRVLGLAACEPLPDLHIWNWDEHP
jgi:dipeptidyl aminopeptidase/acylaminoacyl peptidase